MAHPLSHEKDDAGFYKLARREQVIEGEMLQVVLEAEGTIVDVALTEAEGQLYAFRDVCPHSAFPLSVGYIEGTKLECVGHGWVFDLKTGKALYPPVPKRMVFYELRQDDEDDIWVKVDPLF